MPHVCFCCLCCVLHRLVTVICRYRHEIICALCLALPCMLDTQTCPHLCHPSTQMYTDIKAELEDVQGAFCPGLEAPFGQLNIAFKRLVTPNALNPDGSVPPSVHPGLPWWDMMRYMWRGVASVKVRNLTAVLANTLNPHVRPRDERLALTAATLSVSVAAGRIDMTTTNITAHAHALPPDPSLGE